MTTNQFEHLFSPIQIGNKTVKNRIVISSHTKLYGTPAKLYTDKHAAYYEERARGGAGMIITEMVSAHPGSAGNFPQTACAYLKENIPWFKKVTDGMHRYGATAMLQVYQCGQHGSSSFEASIKPIYGFSPLPCVNLGETPKEMEIEDIKEVLEGFVVSSQNAEEGGFDGVELHGAHSYFIGQSMSPLYNRRTDEYGGSLENRLRFTFETIEGIRAKCSENFILGLRLNGDDLVEGGLTIDDVKEIARRVEQHGMVDYLHISAGAYHAIPVMVGPMEVPLGVYVPFAAAIRAEMDKLPVIAVNRINDPVQAEEILKNGQADLVAMTRACLCDPEMPKKAQEGRVDDIRKCMACNQSCIARLWSQLPVSCVQNPAVGRERELGVDTLSPAEVRKKVVIVGGGPAGLKAAETAAERGHDVVLFEKENELGGQVKLAMKAPTREEFGQCVRYLVHRIDQLGVKTVLDTVVDAEGVEAENPDAVVVATGSSPMKNGITGYKPYEIPGWEQDNVVTAEDVLEDPDMAGQNVLVIDDNNFHRSLAVVETLANKGRHVQVITVAPFAFNQLYLTLNMAHAYGRLLDKDVEFIPQSAVREISGNTATSYNIFLPDKTEKKIEGIDTFVMVTTKKANNELYLDLKKRGNIKDLYNIGDSLSPRRLEPAIWEGLMTGRKL